MDEAIAVPKRLRTDVFLTFGGKALSLLFGLIIVVLLARELGPTRQGLFAVAFSLSVILIHLGGLGLTSANPYFAAREPGQQRRIAANALWLLGQGRMVAYNGVEVVQFALTLIALGFGFWVLDIGVTGALVVVTASRFGSLLGYLAALRLRPGRLDSALARRMLAYGFRAYVAVVVSFLVIRLDLLLVNGYLGSRQAGLYSVAATLADGMYVLPAVVGLNLFPRVARSGSSRETAEVFRSVAVLYGLVCVLTIPLAGPAIRTFFGDDYTGSVSLYYWLLPGIYCLGMLTILAHHFAGRGYPTEAAAVWFVGLGLNLAINVAFLPGRGAWVASLASSIAYAVLLALHVRLFAREAGGYWVLRPRLREVLGFVRTAFARG